MGQIISPIVVSGWSLGHRWWLTGHFLLYILLGPLLMVPLPHFPHWEVGPWIGYYIVCDSMPVGQTFCKPLDDRAGQGSEGRNKGSYLE